MLSILTNPGYAKLFMAQCLALLGTGLLTVALGLIAYDLAGEQAGIVLGTALTIKMVAYVGIAPLANALFARFQRKTVLIAADLVRALVALALPFVDATWQIYALIFVLQTASATFTPAFQATIPDILPDEAEYTKALSLSRLAYDLENIISPTLAGLLLTIITYHWLFVGTVAGFCCSMLLVMATRLPGPDGEMKERSFQDRLTRGARIYLATPRLRGLLALNFAATTAGAMVIVNTVVIVRTTYAGSESDVALALAAFGLGSMIAALSLPQMLEKVSDRPVMFAGAVGSTLVLAVMGIAILWNGWMAWPVLLMAWLLLGLFYSIILTPSGRLLRRSSHNQDRTALFTAQFALSHACWLFSYPLAGWLGHSWGMAATFVVFAVLSTIALLAGFVLWPHSSGKVLEHSHDDLPLDHPHLQQHHSAGMENEKNGRRHRHAFVIDDEHRAWPTHG